MRFNYLKDLFLFASFKINKNTKTIINGTFQLDIFSQDKEG